MISGNAAKPGDLNQPCSEGVLEKIDVIEERILILEYALSALSKKVDELAHSRN